MRLLLCLALVSGCHSNEGIVDYTPQSELLLIDLAGTWHSVRGAQPRSHVLMVQTRIPSTVASAQFVDPDWTPTNGCVVNRYDDAAKPVPNVDQAAGDVSYVAFDTKLLAADGAPPSPPR